jgi:uncharacterized protein YwbE
MSHIHQAGDTYLVTGKLVRGKKFALKTNNPLHAFGINLWNGRVWLVRNGAKTLLKRVQN